MASTLYLKTLDQMLAANPSLFKEFRQIHDLFRGDQTKWKTDFDRVGKDVLKVIEETESRLCTKMENSNRGKFSANLSDKFRTEVRHLYPLIDLIGVTIS